MSGKTNRRRGNNYELQIVKELKDLGFRFEISSQTFEFIPNIRKNNKTKIW